jgi:uncharacterized repeat protein (TIGR01451 family)
VRAEANLPRGAAEIPAAGSAGQWLRIIKSPDPLYVTRGENASFTIVVLNTSPTFAMQDVVVTDELTPDCDLEIGGLPANETFNYSCRQLNVQAPFTNEAVVSGVNATNGQRDSASDTAEVELLALTAVIEPQPAQILAPGGTVHFTITTTNNGSTAVRLNALTSLQLGDLTDPGNTILSENSCAAGGDLPLLAPGGDSFECSFLVEVTGLPGTYPFNVTAAGVVAGDDSVPVTGSGESLVTIYKVILSSLEAARQQVMVGKHIRLTATVQNLGEIEPVTLVTLEDSVLGDVRPYGDCLLPQTLNPGDAYSCKYERTADGAAGEALPIVLNVAAATSQIPPTFLYSQASTSVLLVKPVINFPLVAHVPRPERCKSALPIQINTSYQFYHDMREAFYRFELAQQADVSVLLSEFQTEDGQILVYRDNGGGCADLDRIGFNGNVADEMPVPLGVQQPGRYYVRVINAGELLETVTYTLFVSAEPPAP